MAKKPEGRCFLYIVCESDYKKRPIGFSALLLLAVSAIGSVEASENTPLAFSGAEQSNRTYLEESPVLLKQVEDLMADINRIEKCTQGDRFCKTTAPRLGALTRPGECSPGQMFCKVEEKRVSALTRPGECGIGEVFCERKEKREDDSLALSSAHSDGLKNSSAHAAN